MGVQLQLRHMRPGRSDSASDRQFVYVKQQHQQQKKRAIAELGDTDVKSSAHDRSSSVPRQSWQMLSVDD